MFVCTAQTSVYSELDTHVYVHTFRLLLLHKRKKRHYNAVVDIICQTYGPQCTLIFCK